VPTATGSRRAVFVALLARAALAGGAVLAGDDLAGALFAALVIGADRPVLVLAAVATVFAGSAALARVALALGAAFSALAGSALAGSAFAGADLAVRLDAGLVAAGFIGSAFTGCALTAVDFAVLAAGLPARADVDLAGAGLAGDVALRLLPRAPFKELFAEAVVAEGSGAAAGVADLRLRPAVSGLVTPVTRAAVFSVFVALCAGMALFEAFRTEPVRSAIAIPHIQNGRTAGRRALRGWQEYGT
jgi:hypothetical protein